MIPICIPIFLQPKTDLEEVIGDAEDLLAPAAGMIELRADNASPKQLQSALDLVRLPVIVTIRPTWEGGLSQKSDAERMALWEAAMEEGADYVDVELKAWEKSRAIRELMEDVAGKNGTRLIVSSHHFEGRPKDLHERLERLRAIKAAHILKLAWKADSILDAVEALRLTSEKPAHDSRAVLALAMGEEGALSRLLAAKFGAPFTFASLEAGKESAPGQPTVAELLERYRWQKQSLSTPVFGVVGWPVGHSLSPHIHNAGFDAVDAPGVYVPLPIKPAYEDFAAAVNALRSVPHMNLRGLSVTIPHKENALRYLRDHGGTIDPVSATIGAINTLRFGETGAADPAQLSGFNSDYQGALDALLSAWPEGGVKTLAGKRIAILGAGGAARAIVAALAAHHAEVVIFNRTFEKAVALAAEFHSPSAPVTAQPWENLSASLCDAYINCTPIGMHPKSAASPLDNLPEPAWTRDTVVFDTVYNPLMTRLLKHARRKNARTVAGAEMFIRQAAVQFHAFTGQPAPIDLFRKVVTAALTR